MISHARWANETQSRSQIQGQTWQDINFPWASAVCVVSLRLKWRVWVWDEGEHALPAYPILCILKSRKPKAPSPSHLHPSQSSSTVYISFLTKCEASTSCHTRRDICQLFLRIRILRCFPLSEIECLTMRSGVWGSIWLNCGNDRGFSSKTKWSVRLMYWRNVPSHPSSLDTWVSPHAGCIKLACFHKKNLFPK